MEATFPTCTVKRRPKGRSTKWEKQLKAMLPKGAQAKFPVAKAQEQVSDKGAARPS